MRDLDQLLATRAEFLLGNWLEDAKRWGTTESEQAQFQWNARRVLTLWGTGKSIRDYARKEWSGMINGFYLKRWEWLLREEAEALTSGKSMNTASFQQELLNWEDHWAKQQETYATDPSGDSVEVARRLWEKYGDAFRPDAASLTTGKPVACSSSLPPYPAAWQTTASPTIRTVIGPPTSGNTPAMPGGKWICRSPPRSGAWSSSAITVTSDTTDSSSRPRRTARPGRWSLIGATTS